MKIHLNNAGDGFSGVYVKDFDDNYHRQVTDPSSELQQEARKIRHRYRSMAEYQSAVFVYNEYMEILKRKHGGPQVFKIKLRGGAIDDFIPSKPRLKMNARMRTLLKKKVLVSEVNMKKLNVDAMFDMVDAYTELNPVEDITIDTATPVKGIEKKMLEKTDFAKMIIAKKVNQADVALQYLEQYFNQKNETAVKREEDITSQITLTDIIEGRIPEINGYDDDDDIIQHNGSFFKRSEVRQIAIYEKLGEMGWDHVKLMRQGGVSKELIKNERRRYKKISGKKSKNKGKGKKRRTDQLNNILNNTVINTDQYGTYQDFEEKMMSFTSEAFKNNS